MIAVRTANAILLFISTFVVGNTLAAEKRQPNIVILLADDLGYGELGCQGNREIPTPRIDSIARQGVRFTAAYVAGPNCSPSRAGLMTGKIPTRFGYEFNPIGARNEDPGTGLPHSEVTIAEMLHDVGYTTGLVGKWHLGGAADYHPFHHGFDEFFGFTHEGRYFGPPPYEGMMTMLRRKSLPGGQKGLWVGERNLAYTTHMGHNEPDYDANNPIVRAGQPVEEKEYLTRALAREAADFIRRHDDKPFFLMVTFNAVHSPLQAPLETMEELSDIDDLHRRIFAGMLVELDRGVGEVLDQIEKSGIGGETLVVFLSDNGGPTRELTSGNGPLRGEKGQMYDGALRVPFVMRWNGKLPEGKVYDRPISSLDLFSIAGSLGGGVVPEGVDGVDLIPYLTGEVDGEPHEEFFWRQGHKTALRQGEWKLVNMARGPAEKRWELYQIESDIGEADDVAAKHPEILARLVKRWEELNAQMREPLFR